MNLTSKQPDREKPKLLLPTIDINISPSKHVFQSNGISICSPYELYESQKIFVAYVVQCLQNSQNGIVQSPTGTGKTISLLCSTLSWVRHQQQLGRQPPRLIYTSRTHAQLKQVVHELIKTGFTLKLAVLGSRDQICINDELKQLRGQGKELECRLRVVKLKNLSCKYYHHEEYYQNMSMMGKIADLEEIKGIGMEQGFCPYFYEKHCKNRANLILMPYTYLLDEKLSKDEIGLLIQNSVIIIDEAHNITNACQSSKQFTINLNTLTRALQHLSALRQHKLDEQKGRRKNKSSDDNTNEKGMISSINEVEMHACFVNLTHALIQSLHIPPEESGLVLNIHEFLQILDKGTSNCQFGTFKSKIKQLTESSQRLRSDIKFQPYWSLQSWFTFIFRIQEMYHLDHHQQSHLKCQIAYNGPDIKINIFCLDPKVSFDQLTKMKPRSIILTSGTLSPLNSIPMQLEMQFNKPLACPHIIRKEQVNGCILTRGPNKIKFNFCYENRDNSELFKELGLAVLQIVSKTPNGVIVFVSSYLMLDKVKQELSSCGVMTQLYAKKSIFFEKQNSHDFKPILQKYLLQACKGKGALLFALARGKISQGLDFSDERCRAVVMVGVPYLASKDIKVISKMEYLDEKSKQSKTMNGNQWYICQTIRCINQSIGRIVRNRNDYGSIYLIDERFKKKQIFSQISSWVTSSLKIVDDFQEFQFMLDMFSQYFQKKNNGDEKTQCFFTSQIGTKLTNKITPNQHIKIIKNSVSIHHHSPASNKVVDPEQQLQQLKTQLLDKRPKQIEPEPTRQRIIFTSKQNKKLPVLEAKECPVCRAERRLIGNTECIHEICEECWDIWLKTDLRCPICRVRVREKYLIKP